MSRRLASLLTKSHLFPSPNFVTPVSGAFSASSSLYISIRSIATALNHIAIAVPDLEKATAKYRDVLGLQVTAPQELPEHGVKVVFVKLDNVKLELLEPLGENSPIANFLQRNPAGGMHHMCLEVPDITKAMETITQKKDIRLLDSKPKIGAHGTPVVFMHPKDLNGVLTELEEVKTLKH